jgi:uncharacterized protein YndB with AHSA1/START domain
MSNPAASDSDSMAGREFVHSRLIDAPRERVFRAFAEPVHHFVMTITFAAKGRQTLVGWRQLFDSAEHRQRIAGFVLEANEQNLNRLVAEVRHVV